MAVIAEQGQPDQAIKDLKGKKVAIWPGSTQEAFILERLRMEGMTIKDIEPVRLSFSEMHPALARGDVDAYVGAEPGPGVEPRQRHRPAGRVSVFHADRPAQHGIRRHPEPSPKKS